MSSSWQDELGLNIQCRCRTCLRPSRSAPIGQLRGNRQDAPQSKRFASFRRHRQSSGGNILMTDTDAHPLFKHRGSTRDPLSDVLKYTFACSRTCPISTSEHADAAARTQPERRNRSFQARVSIMRCGFTGTSRGRVAAVCKVESECIRRARFCARSFFTANGDLARLCARNVSFVSGLDDLLAPSESLWRSILRICRGLRH